MEGERGRVRPERRVARRQSRGASVRAQVHAMVQEEIVALGFPPRRPLSEKELADRYGVRRTPAREALIQLADEGLVEIFPQAGTFVSRISAQEVAEAQFVREALECAALRRARTPAR